MADESVQGVWRPACELQESFTAPGAAAATTSGLRSHTGLSPSTNAWATPGREVMVLFCRLC